jgi:hypothetical protein
MVIGGVPEKKVGQKNASTQSFADAEAFQDFAETNDLAQTLTPFTGTLPGAVASARTAMAGELGKTPDVFTTTVGGQAAYVLKGAGGGATQVEVWSGGAKLLDGSRPWSQFAFGDTAATPPGWCWARIRRSSSPLPQSSTVTAR